MKEELCRLAMALAMGGGAGIFYDLLRPLRRKLGDRTGALLDIMFCLLSSFAAFLFAMSAESGRLGIWELTAALLGFLLYLAAAAMELNVIKNILLQGGRFFDVFLFRIDMCMKIIHYDHVLTTN